MKKVLFLVLMLIVCNLTTYGQTPCTSQFPTALDTRSTLCDAGDSAVTQLSISITAGSTVITVTSALKFPATGVINVNNREQVLYTTKTATEFSGLTRGANGTVAQSHAIGVSVTGPFTAQHQKVQSDGIINAQTKLGITPGGQQNTPTNGLILSGSTTAGTSSWKAASTFGFITGSGSANQYALFTGSGTLGFGYLKQETADLAVSMDGAGSGPQFRMYTNGVIGSANFTRGVLKSDPNVIELTAERGGTFSSQVTAIRLNALGSTGLVQIARDGVVNWKFDGIFLTPNGNLTSSIGLPADPLGILRTHSTGGWNMYNAGTLQVGVRSDSLNHLTLYDTAGAQAGYFEFADDVKLHGRGGSPEGVVSSSPGSLISDITNGRAFIKQTGFATTTGYSPIVTQSSSDTLTNKTMDTEVSGNNVTAAFKTFLPAAGCNNVSAGSLWDLPTTNPAQAACVTGTNIQKGVLDFPDTSGGFSAQNHMYIPNDYAGAVDVVILWTTTAITGNVKWSVSTAFTAADGTAVDDPAFNTASTATTSVPGTASRVQTSTIANLTATGIGGSKLMHIKIFRDGADASDTAGATVRLIGVELTLRRTL